MSENKPTEIIARLATLLPELEAVYKDIHAHPELSMQETRTAGIAANHLKALGFGVTTGVGKTGVVGILRNGDGPTVMLRADMDALPIKEAAPCSAHHNFPLMRTTDIHNPHSRLPNPLDINHVSGDDSIMPQRSAATQKQPRLLSTATVFRVSSLFPPCAESGGF